MEWSEDYSVHIDEIDDQHKLLFSAIADLESSLQHPENKLCWSTIHYAIVKLNDFVHIHFSVEEALMRIMQYPELEQHIAQHRGFETYLRDLERRSVTRDITEAEIIEYLRHWLNTHIKLDDYSYSDYFRKVVSLSAA